MATFLGVFAGLFGSSLEGYLSGKLFQGDGGLSVSFFLVLFLLFMLLAMQFFQKQVLDKMYQRNKVLDSLLELSKESGEEK